jgi:hypothetical protein
MAAIVLHSYDVNSENRAKNVFLWSIWVPSGCVVVVSGERIRADVLSTDPTLKSNVSSKHRTML